ncbi:MAG: peptidoglycan editing factor PgeF [Cytophagaceae bacterium]
MFQKQFQNLPLWQFESLSDYTGITHFVSGRNGGFSHGQKGGLNLSYKVGDFPGNVDSNRELLSASLGITIHQLLIPVQTHSMHVKLVDELSCEEELEDTDALVTSAKGICIAVMSADCVPLLFYDPVANVAGAAHAGWKGTVSRIASATVQSMMDNFGSLPGNIIACIGPSISPQVYQVGPEVIEVVRNAFGRINGLVNGINQEGKGYLNLWEANRIQLLELGLKPENIEVAGICTYTRSEDFFSARKSKNQAGRFAAGIIIK